MPALLAAALVAVACEGVTQERQILTSFFHAVRVRDPIMLSRVSVVPIDIRLSGQIQDFTITGVGAEQRLSGGSVTKPVTVEAQIGTPFGEIEHKTFVFTFERKDDGWLITGVQ